jgi:hypothetical protein
MTFYLMQMYLQKVIAKKRDILKGTKEKSKRVGSVSVCQWYGTADLDPYQNVTDQQYRYIYLQCCGSGSESVGSICFRASWIRIRIH